jgi:hypothetical protein
MMRLDISGPQNPSVISILSFSCSRQIFGEGGLCKIFALFVPEKLFLGKLLGRYLGESIQKKVFPARIMHFAETPGTI